MAKIEGLEEVGRRLRALPPELGSKGGGPLRYALMQAAKVLVAEARRLAPRDTGNLEANIVAKRHRNPKAVGATERYDVGLQGGTRQYANNRRNRARRLAGARYRVAGKGFYGRFIELGTQKMKPQPFLRPAIEGKRGEAVAEFVKFFRVAVERAEKKLSKQ